MYPQQRQRYDAIRAATLAKLAARGDELRALDVEARIQRLVDEAAAEFYDDQVALFHDHEFMQRVVERAVYDDERSRQASP